MADHNPDPVESARHELGASLADMREAKLVSGLRRARLLVSGSAALPVHDHERITAGTERQVIERYGMTETLVTAACRPTVNPAPAQ